MRIQTARFLITVGLMSLVTLACSEADTSDAVASVTPISAEALLSAPPAGALILDVRTPEEFSRGHVPGAVNVPHSEVTGRLAELGEDRSRPVVVYCESGKRAGMAEGELLAAGFTDVQHLEGDMRAWRSAGRPTE